MVLNQLNRLKNQMNISNRIVERDLLKEFIGGGTFGLH